MKNVVYLDEIEGVRRTDPDRIVKILIDKEIAGAERVSMGLGIIDSKGEIKTHSHPDTEEIMYIIQGDGEIVVSGREYKIRDNTAIFVPPGVEHAIRNMGNKKFWLLFIYSPPGPEQPLKPK